MRGRKPKLDSVYNRPEKICIYPETEWVCKEKVRNLCDYECKESV